MYDENQQYLDMIIRYSLGKKKNQNGTMRIDSNWLKYKMEKRRAKYREVGSEIKS